MTKEGWSEAEAAARQERQESINYLISCLQRMSPESNGMSLNVTSAMERFDVAFGGAVSKWGVERMSNFWWHRIR